MSILIKAIVIDGDLERIKGLPLNNIDINNILLYSIKYGHLEIVKYAIEKGANIRHDYLDLLNRSIRYEHLEILIFFMEMGKVDVLEDSSGKLLQICIRYDRLEIAKYLIKKGANLHSSIAIQIDIDINDTTKYILLQRGKEEIKELLLMFGNKKMYIIKKLIQNKDLSECYVLIDACREVGVDVYDLVEHEI